MSDENDTNEGNGIADLRKQYETLAKQNKTLLDEVSTYRAEKRQATVAEVLKAKGLPAKAASLYSDEDVSEDAVNKWAEQYAEVFGVKQAADEAANKNAQDAKRVSDASHGQPVEGVNPFTPGMVIGDPVEMEHAIRTLPYEELVRLGYMPKPGNSMYNPQR